MNPVVEYLQDCDSLSVWTGKPAAEVDEIMDGVLIDLDHDGNVVGFTIEHASVLLRPMLDALDTPAPPAPVVVQGGKYFEDSDMLSVWTGKPAAEVDEIMNGVLIDLDHDGNVVGFSLEDASELLRPMLDALTPPAAPTS